MINELIIGISLCDGDKRIQAPDALFPHEIREWMKKRYSEEKEYVIYTKSPVVIDTFVSFFGLYIKEALESISVQSLKDAKKRRIIDVFDPAWMVHFSIGELFARGEFDKILGIKQTDNDKT